MHRYKINNNSQKFNHILLKSKRLILLNLLCFLVLTACNGSENITHIYDFKTAYVGDNSKVIEIVNNQQYPLGIRTDGISIQSSREPYGLNVFVNTNSNPTHKALFENAVVTFSLIDNLSELNYVEKESNKIIVGYKRTEVEQELNTLGKDSLSKISQSQRSLDNFIKSN